MVNIMNKFRNIFKDIDKKDLKIMCKGLKFCLLILAISIVLLITYLFFIHNIFIYQFGIMIFKLSLYFAIDFIVVGIVIDAIQKQIL